MSLFERVVSLQTYHLEAFIILNHSRSNGNDKHFNGRWFTCSARTRIHSRESPFVYILATLIAVINNIVAFTKSFQALYTLICARVEAVATNFIALVPRSNLVST